MNAELEHLQYWDRVYLFVLGFLSFPLACLVSLFLLILVCTLVERVGDWKRGRRFKNR